MRSVVLLALVGVCLSAPLSAKAETGDEARSVRVDTTSKHPAPYPHIHPRRRVVQVAPAPAPAPRRGRMGAYLSLGAVGNFVVQGDDEISKTYGAGGGFNLGMGFRLNEYVAFELGWLASFQENESAPFACNSESGQCVQISQGSIQSVYFDAKVYLLPWSERIEPFIQLGVGAYMLSEALEAELTGIGFHVGGGVDVRLSDFLGVGFKVQYHGFQVDNSEALYTYLPTVSTFLSSVTVEGNLQFHFF